MQRYHTGYSSDMSAVVESRRDYADATKTVVALRFGHDLSITMTPDEAKDLASRLTTAASAYEEAGRGNRS